MATSKVDRLEAQLEALTQAVSTMVNNQASRGRTALESEGTIAETERGKDAVIRIEKLTIREKPWVSIRLFRYNREGELVPDGKRGIALSAEEASALGVPTE